MAGSTGTLTSALSSVTLPSVTADKLGDRSKGDAFVKIVAVGQIVWFILQLITRLYKQLPTSQLEVMHDLGLCPLSTVITPNNSIHISSYEQPGREQLGAAVVVSLLIFGAAHAVAWNFTLLMQEPR
ncbi:hypothetical protein GQ53DRAFT_758336 [Thozetella sp. PMI_491]|nr:hypothetical protein GQ53DRAFT_758336 [Thozetella sp. PMI_491]